MTGAECPIAAFSLGVFEETGLALPLVFLLFLFVFSLGFVDDCRLGLGVPVEKGGKCVRHHKRTIVAGALRRPGRRSPRRRSWRRRAGRGRRGSPGIIPTWGAANSAIGRGLSLSSSAAGPCLKTSHIRKGMIRLSLLRWGVGSFRQLASSNQELTHENGDQENQGESFSDSKLNRASRSTKLLSSIYLLLLLLSPISYLSCSDDVELTIVGRAHDRNARSPCHVEVDLKFNKGDVMALKGAGLCLSLQSTTRQSKVPEMVSRQCGKSVGSWGIVVWYDGIKSWTILSFSSTQALLIYVQQTMLPPLCLLSSKQDRTMITTIILCSVLLIKKRQGSKSTRSRIIGGLCARKQRNQRLYGAKRA
ncbi:hypothetical protein F5Y17DRAFT_417699 [Xylariaceae sp. FL0594]|nr:hypothetical protein F5Y17DRAFT_417699 [Xylariaceae sp. FL0594]